MKGGGLGGDGAPTGRTGSRCAAITMVACHDAALIQLPSTEIPDVGGRFLADRQVEHLVEITIVNVPSHPTDSVYRHMTSAAALGLKASPGAPYSLHSYRSRRKTPGSD